MEADDNDLEIAYELQLEEAIIFSLQEQEEELYLQFNQEQKDAEEQEKELKRIRKEIKIQSYDYLFAQELARIPEDEWVKTGNNVHKPYDEVHHTSSSSSVFDESEPFRLYFKGLHSDASEGVDVVCAVGAAICDSRDNLILNVQKPLIIGGLEQENLEFKVEAEALMEGLKAALSLDIRKISFFCDFHPLFKFITTRWLIKEKNTEELVDQICLLQRKFDSCLPFFVARKDVKFAFKLARDAIDTQITRSAESNPAKILKETCSICLEDTDVGQMFAVDGCLHRYCLSCMKQHVQVKLLHEMMLRCPYEDCKTELNIEICRKFLPTELIDLMEQRLKESFIPVAERVYCPDPRCSKLMSKPEMLSGSNPADLPAIKCIKCHGLFCVDCEVPWHSDINCDEYRRLNPNPSTEDAKLKSLASTRSWTQCSKCKNMIELAEGCYHITCRCRYEFCYTCGAEWRDKKATCKCPIWDEHNIVNEAI